MTIMIITVYLIKLRQLFELQRYQYRKYYKISNWILYSRPIYFYGNIYIFLFRKIIISTLLFFKLDLLFVFPLWIWNWFKKGAFMVYLNRFLISKNNITLTADWAWSVEVSHCLSLSCLHSDGTARFVLSICSTKSGLFREKRTVSLFSVS